MDPASLTLEVPSILGAFLGGLVATLTPCVYPLIPITLSIVGAGRESSRPKALFRALLFCFGIFLSYAILGIIAVISGSFFGAIWSLPSFRIGLGVAIFGYALVSLDLIFFKAEGRLTQTAARLSGNSPYGAFGAGAVSGILAAPCTGALLATILTFAASNPNPAAGVSLLLAYAAGFAVPFFLLSLSPRVLSLAPKSGTWLYGAKFLIGASLLALGLYYLIGSYIATSLLAFDNYKLLALLFAAICLSLSYALGVRSYISDSKQLRILSASLFSLSLIVFSLRVFNLAVLKDDSPVLISETVKSAQSRNVPIVLEFTADWCVKCKELVRDVFSKDEVIGALKEVEFATVDLSEVTAEEKELQASYGVRGLPLIMFLCPNAEELKVARINEVLNSKEFLVRLEEAKSKTPECATAKSS